MNIKVKKLHPDAVLPTYATDGSSGFDLVAIEDVVIFPGDTALVKTGLAMAIPNGYELQVRPRSGMSLKTPLRISNSPGTVDSDFRGQICIIINNIERYNESIGNTGYPQFIKKGDRIAQGVICPVRRVLFEVIDSLEETVRGEGGFGSTDTKHIERDDSEVLTEMEQIEFFLQARGMYYEKGSNNGITPCIFIYFDDNGKVGKEE